ncbi:MAG: polysaccharide biosynthesis tyrosine autokinase [Cephaloticoccus sp.]
MNRPRTIQEWIHWLEAGRCARVVKLAALLLGTLALSLLVAWKQFHGPVSEGTLRQADLARQLARGEGFTTQINYPQVHAVLDARGGGFSATQPLPELYEAPLYALVIAGGLRILPATWRDGLFADPPQPPDGFAADYFLLGLNLILFCIAAGQTYELGRRLFDARVGWVAAFGLLLSVPVWQQVVAVNGLPLLMVLALAVFRCWWSVEMAANDRRVAWGPLAGLGAGGALLFLAEYSAGAIGLVAVGYVAWRLPPARRWAALGVVAGAFALLTAPWIVRNLALTGSPTALAVQNVALKEGDPTALPLTVRTSLDVELPRVDLNKLGNKVLTFWQEHFKARLWSGGADSDPAEEEPFRVLHTNLNLALKPGQPACLVLFSAGPGEGKSTTLHRLTRAMAAAGERVILIDSDLRRPTQHKLGRRPKDPGLCEVLLGRKTMDGVVQRDIVPNLDFVPSGASAGFTLSLLYANRLRELVDTLRGQYDKIIFDSPPIIGVSDAAVLASVVDGAVLLIQHRRNPQSMVVRAQQVIASIKTPLLGVVLNQVPTGTGEDYGYYTHNYSYYSEGDRPRRRSAGQTKSAEPTGGHLALHAPGGKA